MHQGRREQFGQRARDRFDPPVGLAERDVRFRGHADAWQHVPLVIHLLAGYAKRLAELDPPFDAATTGLQSVVVHDALDPLPADVGIGAVRDDGAIFPRDGTLIRHAVRDPPLQLPLAERSLAHQLVERVHRVVRAVECAQRVGELGRG